MRVEECMFCDEPIDGCHEGCRRCTPQQNVMADHDECAADAYRERLREDHRFEAMQAGLDAVYGALTSSRGDKPC